MKIVKQVNDKVFVVQLEDCDFDNDCRVLVTHDYVKFVEIQV